MDKIKIGFVPAHREPFDEKWAAGMRKRCLDAFSKVPNLEIIAPDTKLTTRGLVRDDSDAGKVIKLFRDRDIQGLIVGTMTFGDEISTLSIASAFNNLPLLVFGTKEGDFTEQGARLSDSFCGTLSLSSGLYRRKLPFVFPGIVFPEEADFLNNIADFTRVCSIVNGFVGARIGLIGPRPERFETCICNEDAMIQQFKQRVVPVSLLDIMQLAEKPGNGASEMQKISQAMKKQADLSPLKAKTTRNISALQYALAHFAEEKGLSAMSVQCWTSMQEVYGIASCWAMGRLTDQGIITSCEVDVYGALTMLVQHLASFKKTPPHFIDWTIQHQQKENVFLSWHCGNAPPSLAAKGSDIKIGCHPILSLQLGNDNCMGTAEFQLKPGMVTLCRMTERDGKFKMLITTGKIVQSTQKLRGSWSWVQVPDLKKLYRTLVMEGFTHHASLVHGDYSRSIKQACDFMGVETVIV
jgi:L-fucose isomerase-like protein